MPVDPISKTALIYTSVQLDPRLLSKHTGAEVIRSAKYESGWLHLLECKTPKTYDDLHEALLAIEHHLKAKCFLPVLDDGGRTSGKIVLNPSPDTFVPTETWRRRPDEDGDLLIPGLRRLSKQLQVDFALNVHGTEGKRRREQPKSIYDEETAPRRATKPRVPPANDEDITTSFAEKALDAINRSHAEAMAAKDETIRALTDALVSKEEVLRTQASLIMVLQRGAMR